MGSACSAAEPTNADTEEGTLCASESRLADEFVADVRTADLQTLAAIFKGVIQGFAGEALPAAASLAKKALPALSHFGNAVEYVQKGDPISMMKALQELAAALQALADAMGEAGAVKEQVKDLAKAIAMLKDPKYVVYHVGKELRVNGKEILARVQSAVSNFQAEAWESFGRDIGYIVGEIITPEPGLRLCLLFRQCCHCMGQADAGEETFAA